MAQSRKTVTMPAECVEALRSYAAEPRKGDWREALSVDWYHARRPGLLQAIRNSYGPSVLWQIKRDLSNLKATD